MIKKIINRIKTRGVSSLYIALENKIKKIYYMPRIKIEKFNTELVFLGTDYGGKHFFPFIELQNSTIISCGLGEDASFDVEFASKYKAKVVIADPTPRAIFHYKNILERIGKIALVEYNDSGSILIDAYDLSEVLEEQLVLEEYAIWIKKTILNFYLPPNKDNVSCSITNFLNNYDTGDDKEHIKVDSIRLKDLIEKYKLDRIELLKLDIEGAEIEVIQDMLKNNILPIQICIEFDGLNIPSRRSKNDYEKLDSLFRQHGYLCYFSDGAADFLYVHNSKKGVIS